MKEKIVDLAQKLIQIESTKDNPEALKEVLELALGELGDFTVERFNSSGVPSALVYSSGDKRPEKFKVILNSHLDVVPGPKKLFLPRVEGGKLFGRGAYDMKAAAAVQILVFKELASKLGQNVALQLVCDEEVGGYNCAGYQAREGVKGELVIAGEYTDLRIGNKTKGVLWLEVNFKGLTAHGAYPWLGRNALDVAMDYISKMKTLYPNPNEDKWQTTINVSRIETDNTTFNKVPDSCKVLLDIRMTEEDRKDILDKFKANLPEGASLSTALDEPVHFTPQDHKYLKLLQKVCNKHGEKSEFFYRNGSSDLRHFGKLGMEGIEFGPTGAGQHDDNEWVSISSLEKYYAILKEFLLQLNESTK